MKKFENILICSDVDGTIYCDGHIPEKNLEKLRYFCDNGGRISITTGRGHTDIEFLTTPLADYINVPFTLCNGSYLYDVKKDEILNPQYMDKEHMGDVIDFLMENFSDKLKFDSACDANGLILSKDGSVPNLIGKDLFKVLFTADPTAIREMNRLTVEKFGAYYNFLIGSPVNFEFSPIGVSKRAQFPYLKAHYGNPEIWAIGDYDNDIAMLEAADVSVCPENAADTVKAIAEHHVCHCRDGAVAAMIDLIEKTLDERAKA